MMVTDSYNFTNINNYLNKNLDVLFLGNKIDKRSIFIRDHLKTFNGLLVYLSTDNKFDKLTVTIEDLKIGIKHEYTDLVLIKDLREILKSIKIHTKSVCVDITGIDNVIYFLLIKIFLTELNPKLLFVGYTEPLKYIKDENEFLLSEGILGLRALPGFAKRNNDLKKILVPLLGFERQRLLFLVEEIQPEPTVVPVIGFPTSIPGWKFISQRVNSRAIVKLGCETNIRYCNSTDPFKLYYLLHEISKEFEDHHMLIAPMGIRSHSLGAVLYASINTHCTLIYDFPIEKNYRSEGILKTNIYHLSNYIGFYENY